MYFIYITFVHIHNTDDLTATDLKTLIIFHVKVALWPSWLVPKSSIIPIIETYAPENKAIMEIIEIIMFFHIM